MARIQLARLTRCCVGAGCVALAFTNAGRADRIVLRGGGEIKGVALPADPDQPDIVPVLTRTASRPLELAKSQIVRIESVDDELRSYLGKRDATEQTGAAQLALAEWCEENGLTGPALVHYRAAAELQPELEAAHRKLGHVYHNGRWMTIDERRQAQGLILHKGKWVTPDEKEAMDAKAAFSANQGDWYRQLKVLRKKLYSDDARQAQQAEQQLSTIREPAAVAPMLKVFGGDGVAVRIPIAQIIAAIPGDDAREALVRLLLNEPDQDVRERVLRELATLKHAETVPRLVHALGSKDGAVVGRAAWALAKLDAKSAVPKLIPLLVKTERKWVMTPSASAGGGIGATFGSVEGMRSVPGGVGGGAVAGGSMAGVGGAFAGGASIPVVTGPVVGPGAVAYGATSVPFGNFAGLNAGGNPNRPSAQLITNHYPNEAVLAALQALTGMDFGYDIAAWRRWVASSFRPEADQAAPGAPCPAAVNGPSLRALPRVVIVGAGFGGLAAAKALRNAPVRVTVVDRSNHHLFQPLLYQVATAALNPADIAAPIRRILRKARNTEVLLADVVGITPENRQVVLADGTLDFDELILAAGVSHAYFGNDAWAEHAPGLKSIDDALTIRRRLLLAFEVAERATDPASRRRWMTFVVVGGGPTGVELAGTLADVARKTLSRDFRHIDPAQARIVLVEASDRLLDAFPPDLSASTARQLERLGVEVRLGQRVTGIDADGVQFGDESLPAHTAIWAAGVAGSPLARSLGVPLDRAGRVIVRPDLTIPNDDHIYVIGDLMHAESAGQVVPGVAPAAMQAGLLAAENIKRTLRGQPREPFRYRDKGMLATIGRAAAVAKVGRIKLSGLAAWLLWLFVHIYFLIGFRNRAIVLFQWAWSYFTYDRGARLITGRTRGPLFAQAESAAVEPRTPLD